MFLIEVRISRGKIIDVYIGLFIINVFNLHPNILAIRVFVINPNMRGDGLLEET